MPEPVASLRDKLLQALTPAAAKVLDGASGVHVADRYGQATSELIRRLPPRARQCGVRLFDPLLHPRDSRLMEQHVGHVAWLLAGALQSVRACP